MIKAGIVGATGYTGSELVRLLMGHPEVDIQMVTSESYAGKAFSEVHTFFRDIFDQPLQSIKNVKDRDLEVVFLALPHGVSMDFVKTYRKAGFKIIDLSGDFRLQSPEVYEQWYKKSHVFREGFQSAVYGIPELYREEIKGSRLVANPGCYPTSAILPLAPLLKEKWVQPSIIIDAKSGITGAGIKPSPVTHFASVNDDFKAYGIKTHRHTIEIEENAARLGEEAIKVQFTPHLLPVNRGILTTTYTKPKVPVNEEKLHSLFEGFYKKEPFIRLVKTAPAIKDVRGTNYCDIYCTYDDRTDTIITISVIDNLVRGAAGQAVQNMNILFGLEETDGLHQVPLNP